MQPEGGLGCGFPQIPCSCCSGGNPRVKPPSPVLSHGEGRELSVMLSPGSHPRATMHPSFPWPLSAWFYPKSALPWPGDPRDTGGRINKPVLLMRAWGLEPSWRMGVQG